MRAQNTNVNLDATAHASIAMPAEGGSAVAARPTAPLTHGPSTALAYRYGRATTLLFGLFTGVALFGWTVSTFLTGIHFWALPLPEGIEAAGSMRVITSQWAYVGAVPLALLGAVYYLAVVLAAGLWFQTRHPLILKLLTPVTGLGVLLSAVFVHLQLGPIGAICPFCMMSAGATVALFAIELVMLRGSDLPSMRTLVADARRQLGATSFVWPVILLAIAILALLSFYGVTLAPIPGN